MSEHPPIDSRRGNEIVGQAKELAKVYTPQWTPREGNPGLAFVYLFARLMEIVIDRLNRVPEKHFLAFLDAAGVTPLPPKAAKAPVRFLLAAGAKGDGFVPKGTPLATAIKDQPPVTFETEKDLVVSRSQLASLFAYNPGKDAYSKQSSVIQANEQNKKKEFQPFYGDTRVPHHLYIAHDTMLAINAKTRIEITFTVNNPSSYANFFKDRLNWFCHVKETKVPLTPGADSGPLKVVFDNVEKIERKPEKDTEAQWIWAETVNPLTKQDAALTITAIQCKTQAAAMQPDLLFFNAAALDGTREFYPFGERPKLYDTFSLAYPEAFSKTGSRITLWPAFTKGTTTGITIEWEFWDGEEWKGLGKTSESGVPSGPNPLAFSDTTNAFTASGTSLKIQFNCPAMKETEVNGKKSLWIRARIMSGNYGEDAKLVKTGAGNTLADWTYTPPSYHPPVVTSLPISYAYESPQNPTKLLTYNNFIFPDEAVGVPFKPFKAVEETSPALYLGLDSRPTAGKRTSLYLSVIGSVITEEPVVAWECWTGSIWKSLGVSDGTRNLTEPGIVEFTWPADFEARSLFGEQRFWMRAKLEKGDPSAFRLDGVYPNTVWARHAITITNEILGSSTETPEASFALSRSPVLEGQKIEVREPEKPAEEELDDLKEEEGNDALTPVDEGKGESGATWVRWHEVDHFRFSGRKSRHYMMDRSTGRVTFGDGVHGMVPPAGKDNIQARIYQTGGEERGNVPVNTITVLKRGIAFIDSVFNVDAAGGGSAMETADQLVIRGPQTLKHRERAVTWEDYEWLAKEASFQVARAKCLPAKDSAQAGKVTLIIVPESDDPKPLPAQGLIRQVYQHIRAAMISTADLTIQPPNYVVVSVTAIVYPEEEEQADLVRGLVEQRLRDFFHPLKGGPEGKGWEFGRDVHISEVCKIIEDTPGVHHAEEVAICSAFHDDGTPAIAAPSAGDYTPLLNRVVVGDEYLVRSGDHWILIPGAGEAFPLTAALFLGNIHTREIHYLSNLKTNCRIADIRPENIKYFRCLSGALREGYDFCAWCFGRQYSLR